MVVQRRVYVVGRSGIVLYAAAAEGDPFPEAETFFQSLSSCQLAVPPGPPSAL